MALRSMNAKHISVGVCYFTLLCLKLVSGKLIYKTMGFDETSPPAVLRSAVAICMCPRSQLAEPWRFEVN